MDDHELTARLQEYVSSYKLLEFKKLSDEILLDGSVGCLVDVYLLRAQVKLFAADETMLDDLNAAFKLGVTPKAGCIFSSWLPQDPNSFVVFSKEKGTLGRFLEALPKAGDLLSHWYGEDGHLMASQIQSEILYFTAKLDEAAAIARKQRERVGSSAAAMMASYVLFRCYLAMGETKNAQAAMLDIIKLSGDNASSASCPQMYRTIRDWANITTGWSGDTPRYHETPDGSVLPVLEDRTAAIQKGIAKLGPTEKPFFEYAALCSDSIYTVRNLYMDIFYTLYDYRAGQLEQMGSYFRRVYEISRNSGIIMPLVEYGMQIVPLLKHILTEDKEYEGKWLHETITLAEKYEQSIDEFRS